MTTSKLKQRQKITSDILFKIIDMVREAKPGEPITIYDVNTKTEITIPADSIRKRI